VELRDDTFFGSIVVEFNGRTMAIDARPSDALALAVRAHVPIFVNRSVMQSAGITPEDDLQEMAKSTKPADTPELSEESESRLSIFEDFLDQLGKGKQDDQDVDDEDKTK
jgi:bifunctional DNase/RNase